ncbi:MAG: CvpA family protein [Sphingobacteriales bacterium]|nr:CvpA family protein [Sphingobacteriales bacterium]
MILDIVYAALLVLAMIRGFRRGLVVAVFSFIAVIIGLAAALKLSAVVAGYIGTAVNISSAWLPFVSFLVVFIGVVLLVRLGANAIQSTVEVVMLGWLNRLGGMLLYAVLYTLVYSIFLFYGSQLNLIRPETANASLCEPYITPLGPKVIGAIGQLLPWFRDMFDELTRFFSAVSEQLPTR